MPSTVVLHVLTLTQYFACSTKRSKRGEWAEWEVLSLEDLGVTVEMQDDLEDLVEDNYLLKLIAMSRRYFSSRT